MKAKIFIVAAMSAFLFTATSANANKHKCVYPKDHMVCKQGGAHVKHSKKHGGCSVMTENQKECENKGGKFKEKKKK